MSILKLLNESLFSEENFLYNRMILESEELSEYSILNEHAFEKKPDNWKLYGENDNFYVYYFDVTGTTNPILPRKNQGEDIEAWQNRVSHIKQAHDYDKLSTFNMMATVTIICNSRNGGIADVSFKKQNSTYSDELNLNSLFPVLNGVVYSIDDAMKRSEQKGCPVNVIKFTPITTTDHDKTIPLVDKDGDMIDEMGNKVFYKKDENGNTIIPKIRVDANGNEISNPLPLVMKIAPNRAYSYLRALRTNLPHMGRELLKMDPPDGIGTNVVYYLKPIQSTEMSNERINLKSIIESKDYDAIKQAIGQGARVSPIHIQYALKTMSKDIIDLISSNTNITNTELITASRNKEYNQFLLMLLSKTTGDIAFDALIYELIRHDNVKLINKLFKMSGIELDRNFVKYAITSNAKRTLAQFLKNKNIASNALIDAMMVGNLDAVKMIVNSGVKVTYDIINIPTTKDIKGYLAKILWKGQS